MVQYRSELPPSDDAAQEALTSLQLAQAQLGPGDELLADRLAAVGEELALLQEEVRVQLAELETAARARRDERHLVRRLASSLPVALIVTDVRGAVLEANAAAADLLGAPEAVLLRKPLFAFVAPSGRREARRLLATALAGDGSGEKVIDVAPRAGREGPCHVVLTRTVGDGEHAEEVEVSWVLHPLTDPEAAEDPAEARYRAAIVELCRIAATDSDLHALVRRVAELVADGLPGVAAASVTVGDPAGPTAVAWWSPLAQAADGLQHLAGEGPMFEAFARNAAVTAPQLFADGRWPHLTRIEERNRCVGGAIAVPITHDRRAAGVIVMYSGSAGPSLAGGVVAQARPYVAAVESLVRDTRALDDLAVARDQLQEALSSRAVIDQAKGMIMITRGCTADEAFALLARMSGTGKRKVRDLAHDFVQEASTGRRRFR